jgi:hypothetical protein
MNNYIAIYVPRAHKSFWPPIQERGDTERRLGIWGTRPNAERASHRLVEAALIAALVRRKYGNQYVVFSSIS